MPLHVFLRHCLSSAASAHKDRPAGFDRRALLTTLVATLRDEQVTVILDTPDGPEDHFVLPMAAKHGWRVVRISAGSEGAAFRALLSETRALQLKLKPDETVVILEDDYLVRPGWQDAVEEGLGLADYVTLYDHPDKYGSMYSSLVSKLYKTPSCHWRTTPSTTNSFACRVKTLTEDGSIHHGFSQGNVTADHAKFLALWSSGRTLVSSIPGFWSHEEQGMQN